MPGPDPSERDPEALADRADRLVIVLVEPQHPGNIGACARAMANMGLHRLTIVDPPCFDPERARWMAPGCAHILERARLVATLDQALEGCHQAVATTARHRKGDQAVLDPASFAEAHWSEPDPRRVTALLFGREDFGLSREHVDRCHAVLRIPTPEHASLNLAQAVLLVAGAWFDRGRTEGLRATGRPVGGRRGFKSTRVLDEPTTQPASLPQLIGLTDELVTLLERVGYTRGTPSAKVHQTAIGALQRADLTQNQASAMRGMIARIALVLDRPELLDPESSEP